VLLGRTHGYEGHGVAQVVHGVRTACAAGVRVVVLTNAAGGIAAGLKVGQPVLISDHLNLTATSPLVGPQFVDLTETYSLRLRTLAREIDPSPAEGLYAGMPGPHFETPAEIAAAPLSHQEILTNAASAAARTGGLLRELLSRA
jgi:purine-nucleoside phosphorylase